MYAAMAGLTATIADDVPPDQRGTISAAIYGPQALGIVLGLGLVTALGGAAGSGYPLLAVVLVLTALPWVLRTRERAPGEAGRPRSLGSALRSTWVAPGRSPDYAWAFAGRLRSTWATPWAPRISCSSSPTSCAWPTPRARC
jgi:predicted MFS family arabinose efflux permease